MNRRSVVIAMVLSAGAACPALARQAEAPAPVAGPLGTLEGRVSNLSGRMAGLSPSRPVEYLELGEEVLSEATDASHKRIARELFVLALVLDRRPLANASGSVEDAPAPLPVSFADQPSIGASACLALAFMSEGEDDRRWLTALAATLGSDPAVDLTPIRSTAVSRDPAAFELATLLGWVRAGEGRRAARVLEKPGVAALLEKCDKLLIPVVGGGADRVRRAIDQYPICAQCRNRRSIKGPDGVTLCPMCQGKPGVQFSQREIVNQLKVESMLLSGVQRSWAGQIAADGGSALRDLDASEVALAFGVDPNKPLWRDGRWTVDPASIPAKSGAEGELVQPSATPAPMPASEAKTRQPTP